MRLSVIIPVYNTKDMISRCMDSVLKQQISDMEIICVDDGSTDGSSEILDQYSALDPRVKVVHQANAGLVNARKSGMKLAGGKYTGYVDSDDWIEPEMYEILLYVADQYGADLVSSGYILEKGTKVNYYDGFPEGLYRGEELNILRSQIFFREGEKAAGVRPSLCDKLFRTDLLKKVQMSIPDEVSNCEDRLCTAAYILEAESVYILKKAYYHYQFHMDSMSRREDVYYLDKIGKVYRAFRAMYHHPNFTEKARIQCEIYVMSKVLEGMNTYMGFLVSDLLWTDYKWIELFPEKSKIVLYGAGRLGKVYYRQMIADSKERLRLAGWVDRNYRKLTGYPTRITSPESIMNMDYDYILIALADKEPAEKIGKQIRKEFGVEESKIIWLERQEIFWEYAEAAGVFGRMI